MTAHRAPVGLSPRADVALRRTAVTAVLVIAAAAAVLSYNGLRTLALNSGIPDTLAWLLPVVIDGLTLVGSLGVVHSVLTGLRAWYPWTLTLAGVSVSVWGNVEASPPTVTAQIVHAIPPIVLALSLEALLRVYRYRAVVGVEEMADTGEKHTAARVVSLTQQPLPAAGPVSPVPAPEPTAAPPAPPVPPTPPAVQEPEMSTASPGSVWEPVPLPARIARDPVSTPAPRPEPSTTPDRPDAPADAAVAAATETPRRAAAPTARTSPSTAAPAPAPSRDYRFNPDCTLREQCRELLDQNPDIRPTEAATVLGKDRSNVSKALSKARQDRREDKRAAAQAPRGTSPAPVSPEPVPPAPVSPGPVPVTVPVAPDPVATAAGPPPGALADLPRPAPQSPREADTPVLIDLVDDTVVNPSPAPHRDGQIDDLFQDPFGAAARR